MKRVSVLFATLVLAFSLAACANSTSEPQDYIEDSSKPTPAAEEVEEDSSEEAPETNQDDGFSLKASPDKYTQYVDKYIGLNAASVGYTSLGGDRMIDIGAGLLKATFVTSDGSYVGPDEDEELKNYVVVAQSIEPNTEVKLTFETDDEGNEYDNLVDFQTYEKIDLLVKEIGSDDPEVALVKTNPATDKYTYYIQNYIGKNAASIGYVSLGGEFRDTYGAGSVLLNLAAEDGSFIDVSDISVLKQYVVTGQSIEANSELKYTYSKDSDGNEYSNLIDTQTYDAITLNVKSVTGEPVVSTKEDSVDEVQDSNDASEDSTDSKTMESSSGGEYEAIYNEYKKKLDDRAQELLEEYRVEAANASIDKKAEISNAKVEILAELSNEGVEKMAEHMLSNGDSSAYTEWSGKLYEVYMEHSNTIMDEYINSAF